MATYATPVDRLLKLGRPAEVGRSVKHTSNGFTAADVAELIRLATDRELLNDTEDEAAAYGPIHAWRALGHLRAADAVAPLLSLLRRIDEQDDDWAQEELPLALGLIGEPAVAPLRAYLADMGNPFWARQAAADALGHLGRRYPAHRTACLDAIADELGKFALNPPDLNGGLVSVLLELKAAERVDVIERAYVAGRVDREICGSLADVRAELGLRAPRPAPAIDALDDAIDGALGADWIKRRL